MSNSKKIFAFDGTHCNEYVKRTDIKLKNPDTGEVIYRGSNKVVLAGAGFTARSHFDIPDLEITPSYNSILQLENSVISVPESLERCYLFAIGTGGCGPEASQVFDVPYAGWITPENLVPFRYQLTTDDLTDFDRGKYFGRKVIPEEGRIAYYFKGFESDPVWKQQYTDGTPITGNVYTNPSKMEVESFITLNLRVNKYDARDFFIQTTGINSAKINALSLLTAWKKEVDGYTYYQNIRPLTVFNMTTENLIDLTKGIDIEYQLYY